MGQCDPKNDPWRDEDCWPKPEAWFPATHIDLAEEQLTVSRSYLDELYAKADRLRELEQENARLRAALEERDADQG